MRRLAGSLLYFVAALIVIYSASWMLLGLKDKAQGHAIKIPHKGIFGVQNNKLQNPSPTKIPVFIPTLTLAPIPTSIPKPTLTITPTLTPTNTPAPILTPTSSAKQNPTPTLVSTSGGGDISILDKVNEYRVSKGLSRANSNSETCEFAKTRAGEINSAFNHDGFNQRISSHTLPYGSYSLVTENIAETSNSSDVVSMWINSPPHAENMQKDTPFICVIQNGNYFAYEGWKP